MTEHKLLHVVVPADLLDRVYAAAESEGSTMADYVTKRLQAAVKPAKKTAGKARAKPADK